MTSDRADRIQSALQALQPLVVKLEDDSHKHAGHAGARDGRGHFSLYIVAPSFEGLSHLQRHKAVYAVLSDLLITDIHALAIKAQTPEEAGSAR